jgi:hypothetical protein
MGLILKVFILQVLGILFVGAFRSQARVRRHTFVVSNILFFSMLLISSWDELMGRKLPY